MEAVNLFQKNENIEQGIQHCVQYAYKCQQHLSDTKYADQFYTLADELRNKHKLSHSCVIKHFEPSEYGRDSDKLSNELMKFEVKKRHEDCTIVSHISLCKNCIDAYNKLSNHYHYLRKLKYEEKIKEKIIYTLRHVIGESIKKLLLNDLNPIIHRDISEGYTEIMRERGLFEKPETIDEQMYAEVFEEQEYLNFKLEFSEIIEERMRETWEEHIRKILKEEMREIIKSQESGTEEGISGTMEEEIIESVTKEIWEEIKNVINEHMY
ncbi:hypothetical protein RF11_00997 [Thelohanellus kitauei]|uniref:Uncharacterized protein n=1 Tax=Thelohanellus kitauei TaxID=669202 RepID=A0A0C2MJ20_THEKT|nr:hypothetical protein RF11_00997 [Thelohanellus kitauei]